MMIDETIVQALNSVNSDWM